MVLIGITFAMSLMTIVTAISTIRYMVKHGFKVDPSSLILGIACLFQCFALQRELKIMDIWNVEMAGVFQITNQLGRIIFASEITIHCHKITHSITKSLKLLPLYIILYKMTIKSYYAIYYGFFVVLASSIISCSILNMIYVGNDPLKYIIAFTTLLIALYVLSSVLSIIQLIKFLRSQNVAIVIKKPETNLIMMTIAQYTVAALNQIIILIEYFCGDVCKNYGYQIVKIALTTLGKALTSVVITVLYYQVKILRKLYQDVLTDADILEPLGEQPEY